MDNFVVSARKYRPSSFGTVVGQSHITNTLKNAINSGQVAQAFLFCGPRGVGKTTCARILAKTLNCENRTPDGEACNECGSCKSFNQGTSYNVIELDAASNNSVDDIRNLVEQVRYPPQSGTRKVYIIDEVHMLSNQAFNAFLKTLEEPPSYAIFILATTEKHKIIPTILSRCQIFDFNRIQISDIAGQLSRIAENEDIGAESEALHLIAQKADGAMRDALSLFDMIVTFSPDRKVNYQTTIENLHILDYDYYFRVTDALLTENLSETLLIFDEVLRNGFDGHNFIVGICEHFRNLLVCQDPSTIKLLEVSENVKVKYQEQAKNAHVSFLVTALNIGNQCDFQYKASKNQRLHVELALMKMCYVNRAMVLGEEFEAIKKSEQLAQKQKQGQTQELSSNAPAGYNSRPKTPLKPTPKTSASVDQAKERVVQSLEKQQQQEQARSEVTLRDSPFTDEQLAQAWETFKKHPILEGSPIVATIVATGDYKREGNKITVLLASSTQEQTFQLKLQPALLKHLRDNLKNDHIELSAIIQQDQSGPKRIYTDEDRLKMLEEEYPSLKDLRDKLGLIIG